MKKNQKQKKLYLIMKKNQKLMKIKLKVKIHYQKEGLQEIRKSKIKKILQNQNNKN